MIILSLVHWGLLGKIAFVSIILFLSIVPVFIYKTIYEKYSNNSCAWRSKRIPRENIKSFMGKPIIAYSIEAALQSGLFEEVNVVKS